MRWVLALVFGLIGCGLALVAADRLDSKLTGVCVLGGGTGFAIFGALLGGAGDIVRAIRESRSLPPGGR